MYNRKTVELVLLAPRFNLEQEKVRVGREIAHGGRKASLRDHRFLEDLEGFS